jgi:pyruvate kinase
MTDEAGTLSAGGWDPVEGAALIEALWALRAEMLDREARLAPWLAETDPAQRPSAINLAHYLALRHVDMRDLQARLARIGVSSLGRAETHVLANVDKVLGILHRLSGRPWTSLSAEEPIGFMSGGTLLTQHAQALFGSAPAERRVRIMVTLPSSAAHDDALIEALVTAGMDVARINCAHDQGAAWIAMAIRVRAATSRWNAATNAWPRSRRKSCGPAKRRTCRWSGPRRCWRRWPGPACPRAPRSPTRRWAGAPSA